MILSGPSASTVMRIPKILLFSEIICTFLSFYGLKMRGKLIRTGESSQACILDSWVDPILVLYLCKVQISKLFLVQFSLM